MASPTAKVDLKSENGAAVEVLTITFTPLCTINPPRIFLVNAMPLLLHDHDCLVIPGLGGFLAHPVSARFDSDKGEWIPPGRDVVFNPKLTVRDGLLEQEIRRATGCSTDAATLLIDQEVQALMAKAKSGHHTELPGLGRLFLQEDGQLGFAPEPRLGERYASPGLGRIPWPDLKKEEGHQHHNRRGSKTQSHSCSRGGHRGDQKSLWTATAQNRRCFGLSHDGGRLPVMEPSKQHRVQPFKPFRNIGTRPFCAAN